MGKKFSKLLDELVASVPGAERKPIRGANYESLIEAVGYPSTATKSAVASLCGVELTREHRDQILELQKDWIEADGLVRKYAHTNVPADFRAENLKLATAAGIEQSEGWDRCDFEESYRLKMNAAKKLRAKVSQTAFELVQPYARKFCDACDSLANSVEAAEAALADKLTLPYSPSLSVLSVRRCGREAIRMTSSYCAISGLSPLEICASVCASIPSEK